MRRVILIVLIVMTTLLYIPASTFSLNPRKILVAYCSTLSSSSSTPPSSIPANLTFACGANPAFAATQATTSTPSYSLPQGYAALFVKGRTTIKLSSGVSMNLSQGNYTYLAQYDGSRINVLSPFSITWSSK